VLPAHRGSKAADQQAKALIQTDCDLLDAQRSEASGSQLDRQRDAIQSLADLCHGPRIASSDRERWHHQPRPVREEPAGLRCEHRLLHDVSTAGQLMWREHRQRPNPPGRFAADPKQLATGRQDFDVRAYP